MQIKYDKKLNIVGYACPLPVLKTQQALQALAPGEILWVIASDPQTAQDLPALVAERQDILRAAYQENQEYHYIIEKHSA